MSFFTNLLLVLTSSFTLYACQASDTDTESSVTASDTTALAPKVETDYFLGTILYSATATGSNADGVKIFRDLAASKIEVTFGANHYRQEEMDGMNEGVIIADLDSNTAIYLDPNEQTWERAAFTNLGNLEPEVRAFIASTFEYALESTGETANILGYETTKYKVVESAFIKEGAEVYVWIAEDLKLRPTQYDFETEWKRITAPLPLSYGFKEGAVLRSITNEDGVIVTYEVASIEEGTPEPVQFEVPESYKQYREE